MTEVYSNGKLLLSGEYVVLGGVTGLAIPTKYGQSLSVTEARESKISWKSYDENGKIWFQCDVDLRRLKSEDAITFTSDIEIANTLLYIVTQAQILNSNFLSTGGGFNIETKLTFPRNWGLGTSSTLINNIAQWANVNAFELLKNTMGGSGYDIACAQNNSPILFTKKDEQVEIEKIDFNPPFSNSLFFVFLNKKQNSRNAIAHYRKAEFNKTALIMRLNDITLKMAYCTELRQFEMLMHEHEELLSKALQMETVKSKFFSDYKGALKSLGAWGGDFILATGNNKAPDYFKKKGFETVIPFGEIIL